MKLVGVISPKGGVGKTTVVANLAGSLTRLAGVGQVSVLDLDPQNGLGWHFGQVLELDQTGVCRASVTGRSPWSARVETQLGVDYLPYGWAAESEREAFEQLLTSDIDWLGRLATERPDTDTEVCVVDTAPGDSAYLRQVLHHADMVVTVLLSDGGSYATMTDLEQYLSDMLVVRPGVPVLQVINQVDRSERLSRDVTAAMTASLEEASAYVVVHRDEAVAEALACQRLVAQHAPHGQPSQDFDRLAAAVWRQLAS